MDCLFYQEPWRRHSSTELKLNSPTEDLPMLPAITATKSVSTKLRTITWWDKQELPFLSQTPPHARHCPQPQGPDSILSSFSVPNGTWMSKGLRTPWSWPCHRPRTPKSALAFPHPLSSVSVLLSRPCGISTVELPASCLPERPCPAAQ